MYLVPKSPVIVQAMTKNFGERLDKLLAKFKIDDRILEYIGFAHQFAGNLHKANAMIPDTRLKSIKEQVLKHFTGEI